MNIAKNHVVSISYDLYDADGELIEKMDQPVNYLHGGYEDIFPLIEEALHGKAVGDVCRVTLEPADAFGEYDHSLVTVEPRGLFPADIEVGMKLEGAPEGADEDDFAIFTVVDIDDNNVTLDGNHELAGKTLTFVCTVHAVRPATADEIEHGHVHGEDDDHSHDPNTLH